MKTVAAISTPSSAGGLSVIRISGEQAIETAQRVFKSADGVPLTSIEGYRAKFGHVFNGETKLDQCVALVFRAPHSYTGENTVELSVHGGVYITSCVLDAVLKSGAEPAPPGEFTKRAFLNGKMDLSAAESVMSLIGAQGEASARAALGALEGSLCRKIDVVLEVLTDCSATMAAWVDYPDEEIEELDRKELISSLRPAEEILKALVASYNGGRAVMEGVDTVIAGRPNAGKSTLMNLLTGTDKSIVTDIPGTTRDVVEETVRLGNLVLRLSDTAGLRTSDDAIEAIGIERAYKRLESASLIYAVFDQSQPLSDEDGRLIKLCRGRPCVAVINKNDLNKVMDTDVIEKNFSSVIYITAKSESCPNELIKETEKIIGTLDFDPNAPLLAGKRQYSCCLRALNALSEAITAAENGMTYDAINVSIDCAADCLLELTGRKATLTVVDRIFEKFCVGK